MTQAQAVAKCEHGNHVGKGFFAIALAPIRQQRACSLLLRCAGRIEPKKHSLFFAGIPLNRHLVLNLDLVIENDQEHRSSKLVRAPPIPPP